MSFKQVDVSAKPLSFREATATGLIRLGPDTIKRVRRGGVEKGDPLSLARLAAVLAAKKTSEMILLCHALRLDGVKVTTRIRQFGIEVKATVTAHERTGVEMEALTAVTIALLNVWDAVKQYEKDPQGQYPLTGIDGIRVTSKVKKPFETP